MRFRGPVAPSIIKRHPLTGEPIEPVGFLPSGKCVWPIMGGAPDDDDDDDDDKDDDADSGGDDKKNKDDKDSDSDSGGDKDDVVSKADYDALERRMKAADKRASDLEAERKRLEDAEKDELTKATERAEELEKSVTTLQSENRSLRLQNAFLTANSHTWHDSDVALDLAQSKGYIEDDIVDEDGKVDKKRLKSALDRLAKEKPFLVAEKKSTKDDDDKDLPESGEPAGRRSDNSKDEKAKQAQMRSRFPVLNRGQ
jgi:hypothetical protein